jgi:hypothetical protein
MKSCGLSETHASAGPSNGASTPHAITLKTDIAAGGENLCKSSFNIPIVHVARLLPLLADAFSCLFSSIAQGQKQLVALARGLVRRSKIYILDEAVRRSPLDRPLAPDLKLIKFPSFLLFRLVPDRFRSSRTFPSGIGPCRR